ncbi:ABC transporter substrate-binding protein [Microvirga subterranea]|uniref:NitT/TauT family transport system substrate-binding protein n=1 Tax=Microvirga subterranea TaxID=186651 RepID=A0A370HYC3_9HYPH|nr:ABC transporter substrate-binding protein [Microvirga subterranea]RDI61974.1 NitT/TauT family transport system substrate-binding protein [Microvirga subterranea]
MVSERSTRVGWWFRGVLAGAALLIGSAAAQAQTPVRFSLDWRWEGPAAPFAVALDKGYFKAEGLDVTIDPAAGSREPISRVASGTYDVGFGDVNSLVRFRDENPESGIKAVMVIYDRPPFAIIGRKSRGISKDVASLQGKKFGAPTADGAYAQWPIFKSVNKIDDSTMKFENVGFPVREPMLAQGEVDAVFGFSMSSFINLKSRGVPADDIVVMLMSDYGVDLYGNTIIVSEKFAKEKPEAVKGLLRAIMKGVQDTVKDPASAVDSVIKRNDVAKKDVELERLKMVLEQNMVTPWVKENGFGGIDKDRFAKSLDQIGLTFNYKAKPKVEDVFSEEFLPPADQRKVN